MTDSKLDQKLIALNASLTAKEYFDTKINLLFSQPPTTKMEGMSRVVLAILIRLEQAGIIPSEERAKYEMMIM